MMFVQTMVSKGRFGLDPIGAISIHNTGGERDMLGRVVYSYRLVEDDEIHEGQVRHAPEDGQWALLMRVLWAIGADPTP